jgi:hypothetical protein
MIMMMMMMMVVVVVVVMMMMMTKRSIVIFGQQQNYRYRYISLKIHTHQRSVAFGQQNKIILPIYLSYVHQQNLAQLQQQKLTLQ